MAVVALAGDVEDERGQLAAGQVGGELRRRHHVRAVAGREVGERVVLLGVGVRFAGRRARARQTFLVGPPSDARARELRGDGWSAERVGAAVVGDALCRARDQREVVGQRRVGDAAPSSRAAEGAGERVEVGHVARTDDFRAVAVLLDDHHDVRRRRAGGPSPVRALASASRAERRDRRVAGVRMARRQIAGGRRGPDFQIAVFRRGVGGANRPVERLYLIAGGARNRGPVQALTFGAGHRGRELPGRWGRGREPERRGDRRADREHWSPSRPRIVAFRGLRRRGARHARLRAPGYGGHARPPASAAKPPGAKQTTTANPATMATPTSESPQH